MDTVEILVSDLEEARQILAACNTFLVARDLMEAQIEFRASRPSPLALEVDRIKARFDGYFGDYLLARHEASLEVETEDIEDDNEGAEDGSGELTEASEEPLSGAPLGDFKAPRQQGRRLSKEEVAGE